MAEFDYVVVGSGTAGSTLASRLTEDDACRVLVLEAGGKDTGMWLKLPVGYYKSIYNQKVSHLYKGDHDPGIADRQMDCPRGRVLGGSSSINGLIYIRGQHHDFNDWESMGATGWGYRDVLPHFRSVETFSGNPSQYRGAHGPLQVSELRMDNPACRDWVTAAKDWGLPANDDFNGESTYGVGRYQLTLRGRWRDSAATSFLKPAMQRPNLTVSLRSQVTRLIFKGNRAVGVEYVKDGRTEKVFASTGVVLSAGAVQSPQLLQLSGIGPADHLKGLGIDIVHDSPEVGENLQDHLQMRSIVALNKRGDSINDHMRNPFKLAKMGLDWLISARGPLTVGAGQFGGAACTKYAEDGRPDIQLFVMPLSVDKPGKPLHSYSGFTTSVWQCHPESRGTVRIKSTDPSADPLIKTNYLSTQRDCDVMVEGVKTVREIFDQPAFKNRWSREVIPGEAVRTDAQILEAARKGATTVYHLVGTCRMGSDANSVVNPSLQVNGVEGLWTIDASVMPKITSANTNAATYMIAEKAAEILKQTH